MSKLYSISFKGEVASGFSENDVRESFAQSFQKDDSVIERLFSGDEVLLVRDIDPDRARRAAVQLRSLGALVEVLDEFGLPVEIWPALRPTSVTSD